jgi:hypothetical protein
LLAGRTLPARWGDCRARTGDAVILLVLLMFRPQNNDADVTVSQGSGGAASPRVVLGLRPCKTSPVIRTGRIIESLIQVRICAPDPVC